MHYFQLRKTNRFPSESFDPRSDIQIFAFNLLRIALTKHKSQHGMVV
jgi:hypothetical protein